MVEIQARARAAAPVETVWSVLATQASMAAWAPVSKVTLERQGDTPPDGVGTIRVLSRPPLRIREQITDVDAPVRLTYRLLSGLPVRDYVGETTLTGRAGATDILWRVTMTSRFPGVAIAVRSVVHALVNGLVAESERIAGR